MSHLGTKALLGLVTLTFLLVIGFYAYGTHYIFKEGHAVSLLQREVHNINEREASLESMQQVISETEVERAALKELYLADEEAVVPFIERVETLVRSANVSLDLQSVEIVSLETEPGFAWLELNMSLVGSWDALYRVIAQIERLPYVLETPTVRLSFTEDEESLGSWSGFVTLRVAMINDAL